MWRYLFLSIALLVSVVSGLFAIDTNHAVRSSMLKSNPIATPQAIPVTMHPVATERIPQSEVHPPPVTEPTIPEMLPIFGGTFQMGSNEDASEQPIHKITVSSFLLARYPVTVRQWNECVWAFVCNMIMGVGEDDAAMNNVSWADAQRFVGWLSQVTQQRYRLPSEAEWEYAARGGTDTRYWWGTTMKPGFAVCKGCGSSDAVQVTARPPNPFGLYGIGGGVTEWVEDCWVKDYRGASNDGTIRLVPECRERVLRGGSASNDPSYIRSASRDHYDASVRYPTHGFRVALSP